VNQLKAILTLVLLATWLPATAHCKIEQLPGFAFLECADECSPPADCDSDGCAIEDASYKAPDNGSIVPSLVCVSIVVVVAPSQEQAFQVAKLPDPPELPQNWHFSRRAALPPRAPSFAS
jgi:hypothetical protein